MHIGKWYVYGGHDGELCANINNIRRPKGTKYQPGDVSISFFEEGYPYGYLVVKDTWRLATTEVNSLPRDREELRFETFAAAKAQIQAWLAGLGLATHPLPFTEEEPEDFYDH